MSFIHEVLDQNPLGWELCSSSPERMKVSLVKCVAMFVDLQNAKLVYKPVGKPTALCIESEENSSFVQNEWYSAFPGELRNELKDYIQPGNTRYLKPRNVGSWVRVSCFDSRVDDILFERIKVASEAFHDYIFPNLVDNIPLSIWLKLNKEFVSE